MRFDLQHTGAYNGYPADLIDVEIEANGGLVSFRATNGDGIVSEELIQTLQDAIDELRAHNQKKNER